MSHQAGWVAATITKPLTAAVISDGFKVLELGRSPSIELQRMSSTICKEAPLPCPMVTVQQEVIPCQIDDVPRGFMHFLGDVITI